MTVGIFLGHPENEDYARVPGLETNPIVTRAVRRETLYRRFDEHSQAHPVKELLQWVTRTPMPQFLGEAKRVDSHFL